MNITINLDAASEKQLRPVTNASEKEGDHLVQEIVQEYLDALAFNEEITPEMWAETLASMVPEIYKDEPA